MFDFDRGTKNLSVLSLPVVIRVIQPKPVDAYKSLPKLLKQEELL
ncbi:hypothetical protein [Microseira sp. BLCC-F43]